MEVGKGADAKTVRGHWRSLHGHKIFIAEDGQVYTFNGYTYEATADHELHPLVRAAKSSNPQIHVKLKSSGTHRMYDRYDIHGFTPDQLESALKLHGEAPRKSEWGGGSARRALADLRAGKGIADGDLERIVRLLPDATYDPFAATSADLTPKWNKGDQLSASAANGRKKRWDESQGLTSEQIIKKRALDQKKAAEDAVARRKREVASAREAGKRSKALPDLVPAALAAGDGSKGDMMTKEQHRDCVKIIAAWMHAGIVREATRGATKGQLIIDTTVAKSLFDNMDNKSSESTRISACMAMVAAGGKYAKDWRGTESFVIPASMYYDRLKYLVNFSNSPDLVGLGSQGAPIKVNAQKRIATATYRISELLANHAAHGVPELQALQVGAARAQDVAKGSKQATEAISQAKIEGSQDAALNAQTDENWTPPKKWTMSGFGPKAKLHGYQVKGINWATTVERGLNGFGTGLGKTLAALGTALKLNETGQADQGIIVVPVTKILDWVDEAKKAAPTANVVAVMGDAASRKAALAKAKSAEIVVFGASSLIQPECTDYIKGRQGASLQIDEVHRFKRRGQGMTQALESCMKGRRCVIGYTATPTPNYDDDFFNIVDMCRPGSIGTRGQVVGKKGMQEIMETLLMGGKVDMSRFNALHERAKPWVFTKTRKDSDVKLFVPPHLEQEDWFPPSSVQKHYDDWASNYSFEKNAGKGVLAIMGEMMTLQRQIAISPALVQKKYDGTSALDYNGPEPKIDECVDKILDHVNDRANNGHPFVVSCDFNEGLDRVRHRLIQSGMAPALIGEFTGNTNRTARGTGGQTVRDIAKDAANAGKISVLLLNTAAGGVGLNLQGDKKKGTGPTAIYLLNEPWRDVDTRQVIDRISRQGQQNETTSWIGRVHETIEEHVHALAATKGLVGSYLSHGEEGQARDLLSTIQHKLTLQDQFKLVNMRDDIREKLIKLHEESQTNHNRAKVETAKTAVRRKPATPARKKNPWD